MNTSENPEAAPSGAVSKIALGSCAWAYNDWVGGFYPEAISRSNWLEWYSHYFNAVEVDSTFYHVPSRHAVEHWLSCTPENFTFTVKLPRTITHERHLRNCDDLLLEFLESIELLRPKLGCVLVQLPPFFKRGRDEQALMRFVGDLPREWSFAIEFRDSGWHTPRIVHWLKENSVCWVWTDTEPLDRQAEGAFEWLPQTSDFLYIRLLGDLKTKYRADGSLRHRYGTLQWPRDASLENWGVKLLHHLQESRRVFVMASNHFEGNAPESCQRLAQALQMDLRLPHPTSGGEGEHAAQLDLF